jgi:hypothetical protein
MRSRAVVLRTLSVGLAVSLQLFLGALSAPVVSAAGPVTQTKHTDLGFNTSQAISIDTGVASPPCLSTIIGLCIFHGAVAFSGTLGIAVSFGEDVSFTYDPANLNVPSGPLPVDLKYTPTPNGSSVSYTLSGTLTLNFDGCTNCPAALPVSATSAPVSFTAPMDGDSPVTIPGSSSSLTLLVAGVPIITASIGSTLTLSPAPSTGIPGLGGAAAVVQVSGATGGPLLPIEWDAAGATDSFTLTTPASPAPVGISLGPLVHWVGTAGSAEIDLHWTSQFQSIVSTLANIIGDCLLPFCVPICVAFDCSISDPSPVSLFSGGLGPIYTAAGLDTMIGTAIGGIAGPLVAARVAAGFVPVPLTSPPLASIPPISIGFLSFGIPSVSISGAPAGVVLLGNSIHLTALPAGGTPPFTFAWTKNGAPLATTAAITDTPALGNTTYAVTVTDSLGAVSNLASTLVQVYDFAVSGSPTSLQTLTTGANNYAITESLVPGSPTSGLPTIGLSVSGLPAGASPSFSPASGTAGGFTSTLTITTANAPAGTYTLTLTGTDARPAIGGTRSNTLTLVILTPAQAIPGVIATIDALEANGTLNHGQANSLRVKLLHAIDSLNTKPDQKTACNQLQAFVNEVNAYVASGKLTPAQADTLLGGPLGILAIMAAIPC